jgi:signal transduction histidine kinase
MVFREGERGDGLYFVRRGRIEISAPTQDNDRRIFTHVGPGEVFGEMAVVEDKPRSASARAVDDSELLFFDRRAFLQMAECCPRLALAMLRYTSARLREFNQQYLREVLQAERLAIVGRFARSIVHDLKNPLNIISISAELADMPNSTPENRHQARTRISRQVERISEMINEILEFTQSAPTNVILAPIPYAEFVREILVDITAEAALKGATVEYENQPPEISLLINPKRLRRVFQNLIFNATDAMPEGGKVMLRFRESRDPSGGDPVLITEVEDTGPGIAPEIASRLFEPFATYGKAHGTGLGLSITKRIIEDHRGWIRTRNEPGRGAVFAFALPLSPRS